MSPDPVSDVAHKLRTPIAVVQGFADLLNRDDGRLSEDQRRDYAERILGGAREMREILDAATVAARARGDGGTDEPATDAA